MTSTGEPYPQLTLFAEDTPANHSASPAQETAQTTPDTFGHVSPTAFAYFDHDSRCWKTLQATFHWDSEMYKPTWPRSGTTHNGIAYQLHPSAHRTSATAYSSSLHETMEWTPTATANQMAPSMILRNPGLRLWPTPTAHITKEGGHPSEGRRNTPTLTFQAMWPTPTASSWGNEGSRNLIQQHVEQGDITEAEKRQMISGNGGKLNPEWIEWLMGFPIGWTDLED